MPWWHYQRENAMQYSPADFDAFTRGLTSKSEKIRALARHGIATADIARYLGVRYQHARNVLVQTGLHKVKGGVVQNRPMADADSPASPALPPSVSAAWLEIDGSGRLGLPDGVLATAGLKRGEQVHVRVRDSVIEVRSKEAALQCAFEIVSEFVPPGVSLVDELIAERRREAGRETASSEDAGAQ
jgi:hypothetical protein